MPHGSKHPKSHPKKPSEEEWDEGNDTLRKYRPDIPINETTEEWDDGRGGETLKGGCVTSKAPTIEEACYKSDLDVVQKKRIYPSPTYCTAEYVWETLGMWDQRLQKRKMPDDMGVQSIDYINSMILAEEETIDGLTGNTWRPHRVKDKIVQMMTYQQDAGASWGFRTGMVEEGGNYVMLQRNILPWDPEQGDELWARVGVGGNWVNWTDRVKRGYDDTERSLVWFDYDMGKMYVISMLGARGQAFRISYRYGIVDDVPFSIQRACALRVATQVLDTDWYVTKLGTGGDLGGSIRERKESMMKQANQMLAMKQRPTIARPSYGR